MREPYSVDSDERGLGGVWRRLFGEFATPYILGSIETLSPSCINDGSADEVADHTTGSNLVAIFTSCKVVYSLS